MCETFNCLPEPGGLFDQDEYWIEAFKLVTDARAQKAEVDKNRKKAGQK